MAKFVFLKTMCIGLLIIISDRVDSSMDFHSLSKIGIIKGKTYNYKIRGEPNTKLMVIKLIPNIDVVENCSTTQVNNYKKLVRNVLTPVRIISRYYVKNVIEQNNRVRLFGAIMAGAALGVATAATVTAGIALHRSNENARNIALMKEAIKNTNQAVTKLQLAGQQTLAVIDNIRGEINNQIIPVINKLTCENIGLNVGIKLTQYYSEVLTAFGPAIQDPVNARITIQAISKVFNNNFDELLNVMGYSTQDLYEVLHGGLIRGNVISADPEVGYLALEIEFPNLSVVPNAYIQEIMPISFNVDGDEWVTVVPRHTLIRTTLLSNIDITTCSIIESSIICNNDYALPMSNELINCLQGSTDLCAREKVISNYVPKFALSDGVVYANCLSTVCRCMDNGVPISQSLKSTVMMLDDKKCTIYQIGDILISVGKYMGHIDYNPENVVLGPPIVIDKIDIGNQLAGINQTLQEAGDFIEKSEEILNSINPSVLTLSSMITLYIFLIITVIIAVAALVLSIRLTIKARILTNQFAYGRHSPSMDNVSYVSK
ncbi:fusion protein [melian virus]|uniref:Fusion glycoprotein F0 n=1 Tax=melian virus TaxID=2940995 RepID=A0AAE9HTP6_9MONO|nr:fusion protein [melian virus]